MGTRTAQAAARRGHPIPKPERRGEGAPASLEPSPAQGGSLWSALCVPSSQGRRWPRWSPAEPTLGPLEIGKAGQVVVRIPLTPPPGLQTLGHSA
jgi:hypothetical protein